MAWSKSEPPRSGSHWSSRASDVSTWPFSVQTLQTREHPCEGIKAPQVAREEQLTLVNLGQARNSVHKTMDCMTSAARPLELSVSQGLSRYGWSARYDVSAVFTCPIRRFSGFHLYDTIFLPRWYAVSAVFTCPIGRFSGFHLTIPFTFFLPVRYDVSAVSTCPIRRFSSFHLYDTFHFFFFKPVQYDVSAVSTCPIRRFSSFHLYDTLHFFVPVRHAVSVVFTSTIPFTFLYQYDTRFQWFSPVRYLSLFVFTSKTRRFSDFHQYDTFY